MENNCFQHHIQPITISVDLGREQIFELGRKNPYFQFANFPVNYTYCEEDKMAYGCKCMEAIINV